MPGAQGRDGIVLLVVASASFMEMLDSTVIVTALPKMAESFGTSPLELSVGLTAYIMTLAVFVPASGWIAGRFGAKTVLCSAILLFTAASAACGLSATLWQFVLARIAQGVGASLMSPVGRASVLRTTRKDDLVRTMNLVTFPALIGPLIGPPLGGFITSYASWRWIFFINLPFGVLGIILVLRHLVDPARSARRFDLAGFLFNGVSLAMLLYGMDLLGTPGSSWRIGGAIAGAGALMALASAWRMAHHPHPLIDLSACGTATYVIANSGGTWFRLAVAAPIFVMPLFLQVGLGVDAFTAGLLLLGHTAGDFATSAVNTQTVRRFGFRAVMIATSIAFAASIAACMLFTSGTPYWVIFAVLCVTGICRSLHMVSLSALQFAEISPDAINDASTLSAVLQQITRGVAIGLAATILSVSGNLRGTGALEIADLRIALAAAAVMALAAVPWYARLQGGAAVAVGEHPSR